ncbi:50S ribosomal protein L24 [Gammaproteobacteria bacterium]|nr:50S ribosomal protein L24 [Gammaproteobacteria bacterium]
MGLAKIKKGDKVRISAGKSKGEVGEVLSVGDDRVIVLGMNLVTRHVKSNPQKNIDGGRIKQEASIHISNVQLWHTNDSVAVKVGVKTVNGKRQRMNKKTQEVIS